MTREESLVYRRSCPYDAMGDYTVFLDSDKGKDNQTDCFCFWLTRSYLAEGWYLC